MDSLRLSPGADVYYCQKEIKKWKKTEEEAVSDAYYGGNAVNLCV